MQRFDIGNRQDHEIDLSRPWPFRADELVSVRKQLPGVSIVQ